jgi:hypothetical protein
MLGDLQSMVRDVLTASAAGGHTARIARAHGYVDGYMRALLELAVASKAELLELVASERERASGPAIRTLDVASGADEIAAA